MDPLHISEVLSINVIIVGYTSIVVNGNYIYSYIVVNGNYFIYILYIYIY